MTNDEIYVNAVGVEITLHTYVDLSTAASHLIKVLSPSGATDDWYPTVSGTNDLVYTTEDGDLDEVGTWQWQGKVILGSGTWYSDVKKFDVHDNLV